ncbi:hypothetical protein J5J83_20465 [Azoarcus sp. L1K30]|uniref:hypothetical protein n=1 Tax=Azoarcus sp. L1K30 TaxID=2820277 RepID=UPI001B81DBE5|nr:hypothetical protein [Azoarcus sp. L1K30]MBR0568504.1 hypothetical protein [Azoarcus sp. L1K30]
MDSALRISAVDTSAVQSARQAALPGEARTVSDPRAAGEQASAQVSISAEGRAAEQAAIAAAQSPDAAVAAAQVEVVAPPANAESSRSLESAVATPGPATGASRSERGEVEATEGRAETTAEARSRSEPDAASSANRPAVELYLDNASRSNAQPAPSTVRVSA